ncbi:Jerky protein-like 38 [Homarus americanus]|uniref:Jerky protein-like 38 n=1 Tax=Homarus americanus TaxID=6706 RepID=A0A8J5MNU8_HOMAM|nr:Jerky protein-like 38 [Homarus americanus]
MADYARELYTSGRKLQKERITVLYTTNASGTCKLKLSVIHTARKLHSYKNMDMTKLNVHWLTSRKAWMFTGNSPLLLDRHPNVKVIFLPPNTTSLIQPMDQELICNVKAAFSAKKFKLLNDCTNTKDELRNLLSGTDSESDDNEDAEQELLSVATIRHGITAAGFSETNYDDIMEVIRDPEVTADELLENDDVSEEAGVNSCLPYIQMYHDHINTSRQHNITDFFACNPPQPAQASDIDSADFKGSVREALTTMVDSDGDSPEGQ